MSAKRLTAKKSATPFNNSIPGVADDRLRDLMFSLIRHRRALWGARTILTHDFQMGLLQLKQGGLLGRDEAGEIVDVLQAIWRHYHQAGPTKVRRQDLQDAQNARWVMAFCKCSPAAAMRAVLRVTNRKPRVEDDSLARSLKNRLATATDGIPPQWRVVRSAINDLRPSKSASAADRKRMNKPESKTR